MEDIGGYLTPWSPLRCGDKTEKIEGQLPQQLVKPDYLPDKAKWNFLDGFLKIDFSIL